MVNIKYIMFYLLIINLISFALFFADKQKSKETNGELKKHSSFGKFYGWNTWKHCSNDFISSQNQEA